MALRKLRLWKFYIFGFLIFLLLPVLAACGDTPASTVAPAIATTANPATTTTAPSTTTTVAVTTSSVPATTTAFTTIAINTAPATTMAVAATSKPATTTPATTTATATTPAKTTPAATSTPAVAVKPVAQKVSLEPMSWEPQKWNNCGPVSTIMALSYYGIKKTQDECANAIKPAEQDKKVRPTEIVEYLGKNGIKAYIIENGNFDLLRKFLSNGIPVITQSWLKLDDDIAHYRVIRGYDQSKSVFYVNDSMYDKPNVAVDYTFEEKLWKAFNNRFLPVFRPKDEALVKAILGPDADSQENLKRALLAAESNLDKNPKDIDALRNAGYMRATTGNCEGALQLWDRIVAQGPYGRFLWYQMWPLECLNKLGKYEQALKMADQVLEKAPVYTEARYERAVALVALKRVDEAKKELKMSLLNGYYQPSRDLLDKLGG